MIPNIKLPNIKQSSLLKVAAISVAAPRYMGAFGYAVGLGTISTIPWLASAEVWSGAAMAVLEGWALAYTMGRWRLLRPGSMQWYTLLLMLMLLAATIPLIATPYLVGEQLGLKAKALFADMPTWVQYGWTFIVSAVPVLIVMAVGFADVDEAEHRVAAVQRRATIKLAESKPGFACERCDYRGKTLQGLNAHRRYCKGGAK